MKRFLAILFIITWTVVLTTAAAFFYQEKHPQTQLNALNVGGHDTLGYFYDGKDLWFVIPPHDIDDDEGEMKIIKKQ